MILVRTGKGVSELAASLNQRANSENAPAIRENHSQGLTSVYLQRVSALIGSDSGETGTSVKNNCMIKFQGVEATRRLC